MNRACSARLCLSGLLAALVWSISGTAAAQIKQPGAHYRYGVELDPHVLLQHSDQPIGDEGYGFGLHVGIPFMHNGPIPSINNSIGIKVGIDFAFFGDEDVCRRRGAEFFVEDCDSMNVWIPVTAQWNFYFSKVVSVFAEPGLAFQYESWSLEGTCAGGGDCSQENSDVDPIEPTFWVGGRFLFADRFGLTVRLGYPSMMIGGSILF
ncbi:MAG TPA: hypothetical protein VGK73_37855 [Polyangiaceae bacterium]